MAFEFLTIEELLSRPPKKWIYRNFLGYNDLAMIYGLAGKGKTLVAVDLMMSLVGRSDFACFRIEPDVPSLKVLYCTDEGLDGIPERFRSAIEYHQVGDLEQLKVSLTLPNLYITQHEFSVDTFLEDIRSKYGLDGPDLIFLDTLRNATVGSNENSNDDAAIIAAAAKRIKKVLGCTVVLIHHAGHMGQWPRGASAYLGDMDTIVRIDQGQLKVEKIKDGSLSLPQSFSAVPVGDTESVAVRWEGQETTRCLDFLMERPGQRFTARQIAVELGIQQANVIRELKQVQITDLHTTLEHPDRKPSRVNPTIYWYNDNGLI